MKTLTQSPECMQHISCIPQPAILGGFITATTMHACSRLQQHDERTLPARDSPLIRVMSVASSATGCAIMSTLTARHRATLALIAAKAAFFPLHHSIQRLSTSSAVQCSCNSIAAWLVSIPLEEVWCGLCEGASPWYRFPVSCKQPDANSSSNGIQGTAVAPG